MSDFTVKESSCLARHIFTRRDHYHCGPDKAVKKCDTLLTIAHEPQVRRSDKIVAHRTRGSTLQGTFVSYFIGKSFPAKNSKKKNNDKCTQLDKTGHMKNTSLTLIICHAVVPNGFPMESLLSTLEIDYIRAIRKQQ